MAELSAPPGPARPPHCSTRRPSLSGRGQHVAPIPRGAPLESEELRIQSRIVEQFTPPARQERQGRFLVTKAVSGWQQAVTVVTNWPALTEHQTR